MDDHALSWGPARAWALAFAGTACVALGLAFAADAQGRVLGAAVAVAFGALAVVDLRCSPRLVAGADGVVVRGVFGSRRFGWDDLEAVRVDERIRFGRTVHTLELDAGEDLVVLGPRPLGADPVTVARRLVAAAPAGRRAELGGDVSRGRRPRAR